jgi:predicted GNAT family acetyltransferase
MCAMSLTDKTGAPVTVARADSQFTVTVEEKSVGHMSFVERDEDRVFLHTEVEEAYGGRGLATLLIAEGLAATRADGRRIVALCPMVAAYVKKHDEYDDLVDRPTRAIMDSLQ